MALITHTIPNLTNGVSQQPKTVRLDNQCEEQVNATCRITDGLGKRGSLEYVSGVRFSSPSTLTDANTKSHQLTHKISGVTTVSNIVVDGLSGRVNAGYAQFTNIYLLGATKENTKLLTDANKVYILNKTIKTSLQASSNTDIILKSTGTGFSTKSQEVHLRYQGSLVTVKNGYFGTTYGVTLELLDLAGAIVASVGVMHVTPSSSSAAVDVLQTSTIAQDLRAKLQTAIAGNATMVGKIDPTVYRENNCIQVKFSHDSFENTSADLYKINVRATSSTASEAILAINGTTDDAINLPKAAPTFIYEDLERGRTGYTVKIGTYGEEEAAYYLRYSDTLQGWFETRPPSGTTDVVNPIKLPLVLEVDESGTWTLTQLTLDKRKTGDDISNPQPSFADQTINDLFIFNNRLGFLSTNKISLSKIDDYASFYKTSNASVLQSDRVDISADVTEASNSKLNYAIPFESAIMLFGERAQFKLQTTAGFDVTKTTLRTSTEYTMSDKCPPLNLGSSIYFPVTRDAYSGLYDLSRKDGVGITAEEATHHIATYIKGVITEMTYSSTENMLFVRTAEEKRTIYIQNRYVRQTVLEQNAWHKWTVSNDILSIIVSGPYLYISMIDTDGFTIINNRIDLSLKRLVPTASTTIDFVPTLDNRKLFTQGSTITWDNIFVGYFVGLSQITDLVGVNDRGQVFKGWVAINAALVGEPLWVGFPVNFLYQFSEQVPAANDGERRTVYQYGRLTLRSMRLSYKNTGKFEVKIVPTARVAYTTYFTGITLGTIEALMGKIPITTGVFKFPVNGRSSEVIITIESNNPYPCSFSTCEWQGVFTNNSGRM